MAGAVDELSCSDVTALARPLSAHPYGILKGVVESTMRTGYENGYKVITLSDCVAATSTEEHDNALRYDYPMFSQPMTSTEFIDAIG